MSYTYESSEMFLEVVRLEYQNELDRTKVIDSKIAVALPIIATYFFLAVQFSDLKRLVSTPIVSKSLLGATLEIMIPFSYIAALSLASLSLLFMFKAISTHSYQTVDPKQFNTAEQMSLQKAQFAAAFSTIYIRALEANSSQNNVRAKHYMLGWRLALISLACFVIHVIIRK